MLDLLDLLKLLQLALLLERELLLLLLRQEVSLAIVALRPHHIGTGWWGRHSGGVVVDGVPCIGGGEAVVALGDIRVRPHLRRRVVQYLIYKKKWQQTLLTLNGFNFDLQRFKKRQLGKSRLQASHSLGSHF